MAEKLRESNKPEEIKNKLVDLQVEQAKLMDDIENADMQIRNQARALNTYRAEVKCLEIEREALAHRLTCPKCEQLGDVGPCHRMRRLKDRADEATIAFNEFLEVERSGCEPAKLRRKSEFAKASQDGKLSEFLRTGKPQTREVNGQYA